MSIYRGYTIKPKPEGGYGVYSTNGFLVISQSTEDDCMAWIDEHKKLLATQRDAKEAKDRK